MTSRKLPSSLDCCQLHVGFKSIQKCWVLSVGTWGCEPMGRTHSTWIEIDRIKKGSWEWLQNGIVKRSSLDDPPSSCETLSGPRPFCNNCCCAVDRIHFVVILFYPFSCLRVSSTTSHNPYQNKWAVKIWVPEKSRNMKSSGIPRDLGYPNPSSQKMPCFIPIPGKTISSTMICRGMAHSMALSPATGLWDLWCQWGASRCTHWKICPPYARVCLCFGHSGFFCLLADSRKWK